MENLSCIGDWQVTSYCYGTGKDQSHTQPQGPVSNLSTSVLIETLKIVNLLLLNRNLGNSSNLVLQHCAYHAPDRHTRLLSLLCNLFHYLAHCFFSLPHFLSCDRTLQQSFRTNPRFNDNLPKTCRALTSPTTFPISM